MPARKGWFWRPIGALWWIIEDNHTPVGDMPSAVVTVDLMPGIFHVLWNTFICTCTNNITTAQLTSPAQIGNTALWCVQPYMGSYQSDAAQASSARCIPCSQHQKRRNLQCEELADPVDA